MKKRWILPVVLTLIVSLVVFVGLVFLNRTPATEKHVDEENAEKTENNREEIDAPDEPEKLVDEPENSTT